MSEPTARPPLPGLPPLDPVPWTGTAAPGNTGRPYGEIPDVLPTWTPQRAGAAPGRTGPAGQVSGPPLFADPPEAPLRRGGPGSTGGGDALSAQRAGHRALRIAITGGVLGLVGVVLATAGAQIGALALFLGVIASIVAFVAGIGALRRARVTHTSSTAGGIATALGAVGVCFVLLVGVLFVAFRSEITTYYTCTQQDAGSKAATQACAQSLLDSIQGRGGGTGG